MTGRRVGRIHLSNFAEIGSSVQDLIGDLQMRQWSVLGSEKVKFSSWVALVKLLWILTILLSKKSQKAVASSDGDSDEGRGDADDLYRRVLIIENIEP